MSVRKIVYSVNDYELDPCSAQFGGMQNEHNATEVKYNIDNSFLEKLSKNEGENETRDLFYRIDFNSPGAGYQPSENLTLVNNSVSRKIPRYMTQYGGQMQSTLVISALKNGGEEFEVLSLPGIIRFTPVQKSDSDLAASLPAYQLYIEDKVQESIDENEKSQSFLDNLKNDLEEGKFDGYSPSASITAVNGGAELNVTDRNGTTKVLIRNGDKGDKGDAFKFEDFTPEQLLSLKGDPGDVSMDYLHQNATNAIKGTVSGESIILSDVSPLSHKIKVTIPKNIGATEETKITKGSFIGTIDEIQDSAITEHDWQNEGELGSFEINWNIIPIENRTDLYVDIPAFYGNAAAVLVTNDNDEYRCFRVCSNAGGHVFCYIENSNIYLSFNGTDFITYGVGNNAKIIGISCDGENFSGNKLDLYSCNFNKTTVEVSGKNLLVYPYTQPKFTSHGITFTANADGSVTLNGKNDGTGVSMFYFFNNTKTGNVITLKQGDYIASITPSYDGVSIGGKTSSEKEIKFLIGTALTENTEFKTLFLAVTRNNETTFDNVTVYPMIEQGTEPTEYQPYEHNTYTPGSNGEVLVSSIYPITKINTNKNDGIITAEYNRDIAKVIGKSVLTDKEKAEIINIFENDVAEILFALNSYAQNIMLNSDEKYVLSMYNNAFKTWTTTSDGMLDIKNRDLDGNFITYPVNQSIEGIPYSSVYKTGGDVFINRNLSTFYSAVLNPNSVLYTMPLNTDVNTEIDGLGSGSCTWYGCVCSTFVAALLGQEHYTTRQLNKNYEDLGFERIVISDEDDYKLIKPFMILLEYDSAEDIGHVSLILDVVYKDSKMYLKVLEAWPPVTRYADSQKEKNLWSYIYPKAIGDDPVFRILSKPLNTEKIIDRFSVLPYATDLITQFGNNTWFHLNKSDTSISPKGSTTIKLYNPTGATTIYYKKDSDSNWKDFVISSENVDEIGNINVSGIITSSGKWQFTTNTNNTEYCNIFVFDCNYPDINIAEKTITFNSDDICPGAIPTKVEVVKKRIEDTGWTVTTTQTMLPHAFKLENGKYTADFDNWDYLGSNPGYLTKYWIRSYFDTEYGLTFKDFLVEEPE